MMNRALPLLAVLLAAPAAAQLRGARAVPAGTLSIVPAAPVPVLPPGAPLGGARLAPAPAPSLAPAPAPSVAHAPAALAVPVVAAARPLAAPALRPAAARPAAMSHDEGEPAADPAKKLADAKADAPQVFDGASPMLRPAVEGWKVAGREYSSTRGLVSGLPALTAPTPAVYVYAHGPAEPARRAANTAVGLASGGLLGAFGGMIFFLLGSAVAPIFDLFLGGYGRGPAFAEIYLIAGGFAAFGGVMGAIMAWEESGKPSSFLRTIGGTLYRHAAEGGERLFFETSHEGKRQVVDLHAHAKADELAPAPAPARWPVWKTALAGAAAGAALAVSQWIPLAQIITLPLAGPALFSHAGSALTRGTGIHGGLLGGSMGLLVPVAAFVSFSAVSSVGLASAFFGFVGLFAALGLLLGPLFANALRADIARENAQNPKGQWWAGRPH